MDVILLERIEKLGKLGEVVRVKTGFARNYLLPQGKALRASRDNIAYFESQRAGIEETNARQKGDAESVVSVLDGKTLVMIRQAGDSGQLYGSVSARDIAALLKDDGLPIERRHVVIETPIKMIGLFDVRVMPHPEVAVGIRINVARSAEEAQMQEEQGGVVTAAMSQQRALEEAEARAQALLASTRPATSDTGADESEDEESKEAQEASADGDSAES